MAKLINKTASAHPRSIFKTSEFLGIVICSLSYTLHKIYPLAISEQEPNVITLSVGYILVAFFVLILNLTHKELSKYGQPHEPGMPTTKVIMTGPFWYSRNPTYAAIVLVVQPGLALITGSAWLIALVPLSFLLFWHVMIKEEEAYLHQKFGEDWIDYCVAVRRWL